MGEKRRQHILALYYHRTVRTRIARAATMFDEPQTVISVNWLGLLCVLADCNVPLQA
jgi:hypothetical protein